MGYTKLAYSAIYLLVFFPSVVFAEGFEIKKNQGSGYYDITTYEKKQDMNGNVYTVKGPTEIVSKSQLLYEKAAGPASQRLSLINRYLERINDFEKGTPKPPVKEIPEDRFGKFDVKRAPIDPIYVNPDGTMKWPKDRPMPELQYEFTFYNTETDITGKEFTTTSKRRYSREALDRTKKSYEIRAEDPSDTQAHEQIAAINYYLKRIDEIDHRSV